MLDPQEAVARVASARRGSLLATHRRRLPREELEDCYSQATFEMLMRARRGRPFASAEHIANALEQRLIARIHDRRRAIGGRSPIEAALAQALPLPSCEHSEDGGGCRRLVDERADVQRIALHRHELRRIAHFSRELTRDQRLLLASQVAGERPARFCELHGWTPEKYRKVGQRARARLTRLLLADALVPLVAARSEQQAGNRS